MAELWIYSKTLSQNMIESDRVLHLMLTSDPTHTHTRTHKRIVCSGLRNVNQICDFVALIVTSKLFFSHRCLSVGRWIQLGQQCQIRSSICMSVAPWCWDCERTVVTLVTDGIALQSHTEAGTSSGVAKRVETLVLLRSIS